MRGWCYSGYPVTYAEIHCYCNLPAIAFLQFITLYSPLNRLWSHLGFSSLGKLCNSASECWQLSRRILWGLPLFWFQYQSGISLIMGFYSSTFTSLLYRTLHYRAFLPLYYSHSVPATPSNTHSLSLHLALPTAHISELLNFSQSHGLYQAYSIRWLILPSVFSLSRA